MKVLAVGRHAPDFGDNVEVMACEAVTFAPTTAECVQQWKTLISKAESLGAEGIILQAAPAHAVAAFARLASQRIRLWSVVSVPGKREAGVTKRYALAGADLLSALAFVNPNAKVQVEDGEVVITCDPPTKFVFDHLEQLF